MPRPDLPAAVSRRPSPLLLLAFAVAALVALPLAGIVAQFTEPGTAATWRHLAAHVLPEYLANTALLCLSTGLAVAVIGGGTAWLVAMHDFPGRRWLEWALVLPLAMPAYVLAYVYTDLLQYAGPVQSGLRAAFGWQRGDYWFPEIYGLGGAATVFAASFYVYVYLLARTAFLERAGGAAEAARSLGCGAWGAFLRVSLPLARPAIAAGTALALMETLADYGAVAYYALPTFTTGIYRAWFALGDRAAAAQLAATLLGFVLLLLTLERAARGRARFHGGSRRRSPRRALHGVAAWLATLGCALPLVIGFVLPAGRLLALAHADGDAQLGPRFLTLAGNSLAISALTAALATLLALALAYGARLARGPARRAAGLLNRGIALGYAVPGSVIAVGILIPVTRLDHAIAALWQSLGQPHPGLLLTGGLAALVYGYLVRFLSVAVQTVDTGLSRITVSMDEAARSLGRGRGALLREVHLPLLRGSLASAALLVFVDTMKELPATLVMRPFNFDTLATQVYTLAADERLAEASTAALAIVAVGVLPLILLSRHIAQGTQPQDG